jgi:hypothetical protein
MPGLLGGLVQVQMEVIMEVIMEVMVPMVMVPMVMVPMGTDPTLPPLRAPVPRHSPRGRLAREDKAKASSSDSDTSVLQVPPGPAVEAVPLPRPLVAVSTADQSAGEEGAQPRRHRPSPVLTSRDSTCTPSKGSITGHKM